MKKYILDLTVRSVERVHERYVLMKLTQQAPLPPMNPGQFVEVRVDGSSSTFLRRPISIHFVDYQNNELWLLVACVGDGTRRLAELKAGEVVNCVLPLGNGFTVESDNVALYGEGDIQKGAQDGNGAQDGDEAQDGNEAQGGNEAQRNGEAQAKGALRRVLLAGGGVGVAPLLYLGKVLKEQGVESTFLLGARSAKDLLMLSEFEKYGRVLVTTEDGSMGEKGFVTNHSVLQQETFDLIQVCGPTPMMKAVARYAHEKGIACEVSLENLMACGLGACLCCVEKVKTSPDYQSPTTNVCVCKEGPVFNINRLLWQS